MSRTRVAIAAALGILFVWHGNLRAAEPANPAGWSLSADGAFAIHAASRLAWPRCVEGMVWDGHDCRGDALLLTHAQALARAAERSRAEGVTWRVPRAPELQRLARRNVAPGLDARLFPGAPIDWHWTSTALIDSSAVNPYNYDNIRRGVTAENVNRLAYLHGVAVHTGSGALNGEVTKRTLLPVRLVRQMPAPAAR